MLHHRAETFRAAACDGRQRAAVHGDQLVAHAEQPVQRGIQRTLALGLDHHALHARGTDLLHRYNAFKALEMHVTCTIDVPE